MDQPLLKLESDIETIRHHYNTMYTHVKPIVDLFIGPGSRTMVYLGMGCDLIRPFFLHDIDLLIAYDLHDNISCWINREDAY